MEDSSSRKRHMELHTVSRTRKAYWIKKLEEEGIEYKEGILDITKTFTLEFDIPERKLAYFSSALLIPYDDIEFRYSEF